MDLQPVDRVESIGAEEFKDRYYAPMKPLVITGLSKHVAGLSKNGTGIFSKPSSDEVEVGVYNNVKSDAYTPINTADDYMKFGDYIEMVRKGPAEWRIFLFNIFEHAPQITA